jgi:hypothetical protein
MGEALVHFRLNLNVYDVVYSPPMVSTKLKWILRMLMIILTLTTGNIKQGSNLSTASFRGMGTGGMIGTQVASARYGKV